MKVGNKWLEDKEKGKERKNLSLEEEEEEIITSKTIYKIKQKEVHHERLNVKIGLEVTKNNNNLYSK